LHLADQLFIIEAQANAPGVQSARLPNGIAARTKMMRRALFWYSAPPSTTVFVDFEVSFKDRSVQNGFLSRAQVRELDRRASADYGVPGLTLMENAGRGAAATLLGLGVHGPVLIVCGKGNNGGDGLVMARHLAQWEVDVKVLLVAGIDELSVDAAANWQAVEKMRLPVLADANPDDAVFAVELARHEWVVDALFGTGLQGPVRAPFDRLIGAINAGPARVFAVDIPSGLDCDTGAPLGATVRAEHTATFVGPKAGYANPAARAWTGLVHVVDIGVPA
jgi:NAD(P)H-hydrate epimerase